MKKKREGKKKSKINKNKNGLSFIKYNSDVEKILIGYLNINLYIYFKY